MSALRKANARRRTGRRGKLTAGNYSLPAVSQAEATLLLEVAKLRLIQRPYREVFWDLEREIALLCDELERRRTCARQSYA